MYIYLYIYKRTIYRQVKILKSHHLTQLNVICHSRKIPFSPAATDQLQVVSGDGPILPPKLWWIEEWVSWKSSWNSSILKKDVRVCPRVKHHGRSGCILEKLSRTVDEKDNLSILINDTESSDRKHARWYCKGDMSLPQVETSRRKKHSRHLSRKARRIFKPGWHLTLRKTCICWFMLS